jgi:diphthine methyl ester acylhydrolase
MFLVIILPRPYLKPYTRSSILLLTTKTSIPATMTSINSIDSLILDLPPSCIEFWPLNPQYAVVGTYHLEKPDGPEEASTEEEADASVAAEFKPQERNGSIALLRIDNDKM